MKKVILFSAIALLLSATIGCEKDEAKEKNWKSLPPATQKGKNTIGCLVDGQLWATNYWNSDYLFSPHSMEADFYRKVRIDSSYIVNMGKTYCFLRAKKKDGRFIHIHITTPNIQTEQRLKGEVFISLGFGEIFISKKPYIYLTKFDTINKIISGRFSCIAINRENVIPELQSKDTVKIKITDGRFDMKLRIKESFK